MPESRGAEPSWGSKPFPKGERAGTFVTLASGLSGDDDALPIRTSARLVAATLNAGQRAEYRFAEGRKGYLVAALGTLEINDVTAAAGDGVAIKDEAIIQVRALEDSEVILVVVA